MARGKRETWAIDIDDVCLDYGGGFTRFNNRVGWTSGMKPHEYSEQWGQLWGGVDSGEIARRTKSINRGMNPFLRPVRDSQLALTALAKRHDLVILTSRPRDIHETTKSTIDRHFPDIFRDIHYLQGGWGERGANEAVTKGEAAIEIGASTLVDDQPRHAIGMARAGGVGLLFGDRQIASTTVSGEAGVIRVANWREVLAHAEIDPNSVLPEN